MADTNARGAGGAGGVGGSDGAGGSGGGRRRSRDDAPSPRKAPRGKYHDLRLEILNDPTILANEGWDRMPEPFSLTQCRRYIDWCHIDRHFKPERHERHVTGGKALFDACTNALMKVRIQEVCHAAYGYLRPADGYISMGIMQMVYAELVLRKRVLWSTLVIPIPRSRPEAGRNHRIGDVVPMIPDLRIGNVEAEVRNEQADEERLATRVMDHLVAGEGIIGLHFNEQDHIEVNPVPMDSDSLGFDTQPDPAGGNVPVVGTPQCTVHIPSTPSTPRGSAPTSPSSNAMVLSLSNDLRQSRAREAEKEKMIIEKDKMIKELQEELERLKIQLANSNNSSNAEEVGVRGDDRDVDKGKGPMDVEEEEEYNRDHGLEYYNKAKKLQMKYKLLEIQNNQFRKQLAETSNDYYNWKIACSLSVSREDQLRMELSRIGASYTMDSTLRAFGLTSWPLINELFPDDEDNMPTLQTGSIDWNRVVGDDAWPYETATSSRVDRNPGLLWPNPASFVSDGSKCAICNEVFGPEGGWAVGTCQHLWHPQCLLAIMMIKKRCCICKAPFHNRLYNCLG